MALADEQSMLPLDAHEIDSATDVLPLLPSGPQEENISQEENCGQLIASPRWRLVRDPPAEGGYFQRATKFCSHVTLGWGESWRAHPTAGCA